MPKTLIGPPGGQISISLSDLRCGGKHIVPPPIYIVDKYEKENLWAIDGTTMKRVFFCKRCGEWIPYEPRVELVLQ